MSTFITLPDLKSTPLKNTLVNFVKVYIKDKSFKYLNAAGEELDVVLDRPLDNFTIPGSASPITSSDTIASALGKIQASLNSGGGLEGTNYVYVAANGTDVENAAELQAAYDLAVIKAMPLVAPTNIPLSSVTDTGGGTYTLETTEYLDSVYFSGGNTYSVVINGVLYLMSVTFTMYPTIFVSGLPDGLSFTSLTLNVTTFPKVTVIAAPGDYNFEDSNFVMNTERINLVSLDGNRSIIFNSASTTGGTISITANEVFVKGVDVQSKIFKIATNLNLLKVENCKGGGNSFGGDTSFFSPKIISGTFINCEAGFYSFGGSQGGTTSGKFINCVSDSDSFGQIASGIFEGCKSGGNSFGGNGGTASGIFKNCTADSYSFGGYFGIASGTFENCKGGNLAFGALGTISGVFTNCEGLESSFGTNASEISGTLINCIGGNYSFVAPVTGRIMFGGFKNFSQVGPSVGLGGSIIGFVDWDKKLLSTSGVKFTP